MTFRGCLVFGMTRFLKRTRPFRNLKIRFVEETNFFPVFDGPVFHMICTGSVKTASFHSGIESRFLGTC